MPGIRTATLALVFALPAPLVAGDLHGTVKCVGARDSADAVVYVDAIPGRTFPPPTEHAVVNQQNLTFGPHVLPVLVGTTVDFLNSDSVLHNVFTPDSCAGKFNLGSWPKGEKRSHKFQKECFVALLCMVHPEMEGFVAALPTPWYAVTGPDGKFRIADVADGEYTVKVWHPKLKATKRSVKVQASTGADFELSR